MIEIRANNISLDLDKEQSLEFVIENPLFLADRIPIAHTFNINFPKTATNKKVFGVVDGLFIQPRNRKVSAQILLGGVEIFKGILTYDQHSSTDKSISATFVNTDFSDDLDKYLYEIESIGSVEIASISSGVFSTIEDEKVFVTPLVMNTSTEQPVLLNLTPLTNPNASNKAELPAIFVNFLLKFILKNNNLTSHAFYSGLMDTLVLFSNRHPVATKVYDETNRYPFDQTLPQMKINEFLFSLLNLLCATLYIDRNNTYLVSNKELILSANHVDWSDKIHDRYTTFMSDKMMYSYGYDSDIDYPESPIDDYPTRCATILDMQERGQDDPQKSYRIESTDEVFVRTIHRFDEGGSQWVEHSYELIANNRLKGYSNDGDSVISVVSKFIPAENNLSHPRGHYVSIVKITNEEDDPSSEAKIGQFVGKQPTKTTAESGWPLTTLCHPYNSIGTKVTSSSLAWQGEDGLYEKFHKEYAQWMNKDRLCVRMPVRLNIKDICNITQLLQLKVLIKNHLFFIKNINLSISYLGDILTDVEFIEA